MRVLVIGGTRFIGPRVVRRLVAAEHIVTVFHRGQHTSALPAAVRSITDPRAGIPVTVFPKNVVEFEPELVLHMIAMGEHDGAAARRAFANVARRIVMLSSGDVYRAYGCFSKIESEPVEQIPLTEDSKLRTVLYPYRTPVTANDSLEYFYEKILAEREIAADPNLPATILRLPKVYGPGENADLATVYGFRNNPNWRWTHGFVDNVAAAIALAVTDEHAKGRIYNIGEETTPTVRERLAYLPPRPDASVINNEGNFDQDVAYDTSRIRSELGFVEPLPERQAMIDTVSEYLASQTK
jgi:nucleoside-diphosphate-sugar epimerase